MVWFYLQLSNRAISVSVNFQSHYGLILSPAEIFESARPMSTFNPTMVWFYQTQFLKFLKIKFTFQSHYGLILSFFN